MPKCVSKLCLDVFVNFLFCDPANVDFIETYCQSKTNNWCQSYIHPPWDNSTKVLLKRYVPHKKALNQKRTWSNDSGTGQLSVRSSTQAPKRVDWHRICTAGWHGYMFMEKMPLPIPTSPGNILKNIIICSSAFFAVGQNLTFVVCFQEAMHW